MDDVFRRFVLVALGTLARFAGPGAVAVAEVVLLKFLSGAVTVMAWGYPLRTATLVGLGTEQMGEFPSVLAQSSRVPGLMADWLFLFFVLMAVTTMPVNPFLIDRAPALTRSPSLPTHRPPDRASEDSTCAAEPGPPCWRPNGTAG